jgi:hypothetical protein
MSADHQFVFPVSVREMTAADRATQARLVRRAANFAPVRATAMETFPFRRYGGRD